MSGPNVALVQKLAHELRPVGLDVVRRDGTSVDVIRLDNGRKVATIGFGRDETLRGALRELRRRGIAC